MTKTVFLKEGDLQTTTLLLDGSNQGVVRVPGNGGSKAKARGIIHITARSKRFESKEDSKVLREGNRAKFLGKDLNDLGILAVRIVNAKVFSVTSPTNRHIRWRCFRMKAFQYSLVQNLK